jgi:hypothetical protein
MPEFKEIVAQSWAAPVSTANKARLLHIELSRLAKVLKRWHKHKTAEARRQTTQAQELVLQLDGLQDERQLTTQEFQAHKEAKNKILALAVVRKIRIRQRCCLTWIRVGDANTKLFHLRANE